MSEEQEKGEGNNQTKTDSNENTGLDGRETTVTEGGGKQSTSDRIKSNRNSQNDGSPAVSKVVSGFHKSVQAGATAGKTAVDFPHHLLKLLRKIWDGVAFGDPPSRPRPGLQTGVASLGALLAVLAALVIFLWATKQLGPFWDWVTAAPLTDRILIMNILIGFVVCILLPAGAGLVVNGASLNASYLTLLLRGALFPAYVVVLGLLIALLFVIGSYLIKLFFSGNIEEASA